MHYMVSEIFVGSHRSRGPLSRMPGWYAFFGFLLVFGLALAHSINIAAPSSPGNRFYTKKYLQELVVGKTQAEVIDLLGTPYVLSRDPLHKRQIYVYKWIIRDVRTNTFAPEAHIYFKEQYSGSFVVQQLNTVWIEGAHKAAAKNGFLTEG